MNGTRTNAGTCPIVAVPGWLWVQVNAGNDPRVGTVPGGTSICSLTAPARPSVGVTGTQMGQR